MQSFILIQDFRKRNTEVNRLGERGLFSKKMLFFHKKVPFLANIECFLKFPEYGC